MLFLQFETSPLYQPNISTKSISYPWTMDPALTQSVPTQDG